MALDLHLQATSPCRDTGIEIGLTLDFDGNTVPYAGGTPDMGAYEWHETGAGGDFCLTLSMGMS